MHFPSRIDAHQHFWRYNPAEHVWMSDGMKVLKRDFLPEDLKPLLSGTYAETMKIVTDYVQQFPTDIQNAILGGNCLRIYSCT